MKHATLQQKGRRTCAPRGAVDLSIVVPIYNEVDNIDAFHASLLPVLEQLDHYWEVVYVDDGSRDGSGAKLALLADADERVQIVTFRRNFGQTAALSAGIRSSRGAVIITLDGDCQNDPRDIPRLLTKLAEGHDVVSGWRIKRQDGRLFRTIPSKIANRLISRVTAVPLHDYGCTLKAYRREILDEIELYGEMHRFIPAYAAMVGASIAELPVMHHPRLRGKSKYGLSRIFRVLLDLLTVKFLTTYATKPLYLFGRFAFGIFGLAGLLIVTMIVQRIASGFFFVESPLLILTAMLIIIGSQTILMGLLAELGMRTYHESQQKLTYILRSEVPIGRRASAERYASPLVSDLGLGEPIEERALVEEVS